MCFMKMPDMPEAPQQRKAARQPDSGEPAIRDADKRRRRLAMASSIFTGPTMGAPTTTSSLGA